MRYGEKRSEVGSRANGRPANLLSLLVWQRDEKSRVFRGQKSRVLESSALNRVAIAGVDFPFGTVIRVSIGAGTYEPTVSRGHIRRGN
jgi:hypothetical protein